jgi:hypothetical protein
MRPQPFVNRPDHTTGGPGKDASTTRTATLESVSINRGTARNGRTPEATPPSGITATSTGPAGNAAPSPATVAIGPTVSAPGISARSAEGVDAAAGAAAEAGSAPVAGVDATTNSEATTAPDTTPTSDRRSIPTPAFVQQRGVAADQ